MQFGVAGLLVVAMNDIYSGFYRRVNPPDIIT